MQFTYIKKDCFGIRIYMFKNGDITRLDTFKVEDMEKAIDFVSTFSVSWGVEYKGLLAD